MNLLHVLLAGMMLLPLIAAMDSANTPTGGNRRNSVPQRNASDEHPAP
eukprot:CAMPEP_0176448136 /NCGR_PEP_ID=MMETSP0127-20121128/25562_1 /TAXON_ID=938130 /ORGANISM="Platyophrya macrostoma, Strain WH" /LENGTH=47 /DNA_ID= /DNA_START= /DNA_END= /DNA_ORIENTATION=